MRTSRAATRGWILVPGALAALGCGRAHYDVLDGRVVDPSSIDARVLDARVLDAAPLDAAPLDGPPFDAVGFDAPAPERDADVSTDGDVDALVLADAHESRGDAGDAAGPCRVLATWLDSTGVDNVTGIAIGPSGQELWWGFASEAATFPGLTRGSFLARVVAGVGATWSITERAIAATLDDTHVWFLVSASGGYDVVRVDLATGSGRVLIGTLRGVCSSPMIALDPPRGLLVSASLNGPTSWNGAPLASPTLEWDVLVLRLDFAGGVISQQAGSAPDLDGAWDVAARGDTVLVSGHSNAPPICFGAECSTSREWVFQSTMDGPFVELPLLARTGSEVLFDATMNVYAAGAVTASVSPAGASRWSTAGLIFPAMALSPDGSRVWLSGLLGTPRMFGPVTLTAPGPATALAIVGLDSATGGLVDAVVPGPTTPIMISLRGMAVRPDGRPVVVGDAEERFAVCPDEIVPTTDELGFVITLAPP